MEKQDATSVFDTKRQVSVTETALSSSAPRDEPDPRRAPSRRHGGCWLCVPDLFRKASDGWALEVAGLGLSTASFLGLLVVLVKNNGKPLNDWTFFFSLNTVISILSTAMKVPLASAVGTCLGQSKWVWLRKRPGSIAHFVDFDEASRGSLGCVPLLFRLKSWHWASLGAWVTILLVLVDPSMQALIDYPGRLDTVTSKTQSTISRGVPRLDIGSWFLDKSEGALYHGQNITNLTTPYGNYECDSGLLLSALTGFSNWTASSADPVQSPALACPTGNCTWPLYSTVEICSACADISSNLVRSRGYGRAFFCDGGVDPGTPVNYINYTVPYHFPDSYQLERYYNEDDTVLQGYGGMFNTSGSCALFGNGKRDTAMSLRLRPNDTYSFQQWDTLLGSITIVRPTDDFYNNKIPFENEAAITATECAFRFCGQVRKASMQNGVLSDVSLDGSTFVRLPASFQLTRPMAQSMRETIDSDFGRSLTIGDNYPWGVFDRTDLQLILPDNSTGFAAAVAEAPPSTSLEQAQRALNITQKTIETSMDMLARLVLEEIAVNAIAASDDLAATFAAVARTMTARLRNLDPAPLRGDVQQWTVHIHVRWQFLVLPGLMLGGTAVFIGATAWDSRRLKLLALKSSLLESLVHGPDGDTKDWLRRQKDRAQAAEEAVVQLVEGDDEDAWELRWAPRRDGGRPPAPHTW